MEINIKQLLSEKNMSQADLARELVKAGIFKNFNTAKTTLQYHINKKYKSIDSELLEYLMKRFDKTLCELIKF